MNPQHLLDSAYRQVLAGQVIPALRLLGKPLSDLYIQNEQEDRSKELISTARAHPLFELTQQDPYTARAYNKPRGYAGDAVMLDYIYTGQTDHGISPMGARIFQGTTRVSMGLSVVYRKALLNAYINDAAALHSPFSILSVASGHCREIEGSLVLNDAFQGAFIALDADAQSCAEVTATYTNPKVRALHGNVKQLLQNEVALPGLFNFIYSAGLFDYLNDAIARKLIATLLTRLAPQGRLLVANFVPSAYGRGYMACFMDWHLIYRTVDELKALFPEALRPQVTVTTDPHGNVAYAVYENNGDVI